MSRNGVIKRAMSGGRNVGLVRRGARIDPAVAARMSVYYGGGFSV